MPKLLSGRTRENCRHETAVGQYLRSQKVLRPVTGPARSRFFTNLPANTPLHPQQIPRKSLVKTTLPVTLTCSPTCAAKSLSPRKQAFCRTGGGGAPSNSPIPIPGILTSEHHTSFVDPFQRALQLRQLTLQIGLARAVRLPSDKVLQATLLGSEDVCRPAGVRRRRVASRAPGSCRAGRPNRAPACFRLR